MRMNVLLVLSKQTTGSMEIDCTYDSFGNILTATNYTGTYTYAYTYNNLLQGIEAPDGKEISYVYDGNHNVSRVTDYSNDIIDYEYDGNNNVSGIKRNNTNVASYEYYPYGALQRVTYPGHGKSEYTYDNALRLVNQVNSLSDNTVVNSYGYTYDLNGNQIQKNDNENITNYTYDSLNRLQSVTEPDGTQTAYTFDVQGNIMTKSVSHPSGFEFDFTQDGIDRTLTSVLSHEFIYAYDNNNRLKFEGEYISGTGVDFCGNIEITKYSDYDNNGNLLVTNIGGQIDEKTVRYTYNPLNQLSQYTDEEGNRTNYFYSPDGMRNTKIQGDITTKYYWDRNYMSAESVDGNITSKNYVGAQGIFARETTDRTDYMLKSGHGDVVSLVNNGTVSKIYDYDAYGVEKNPTATDTNPFRYCGEYSDTESGQIYLRNRYYLPTTGRFITEDPIKDGLNWYGYCENNPITKFDPSGYITQDEIDIFENGQMAPMAYSHLMNLTFHWYLADDEDSRRAYNEWANDFRATGYTTTYGAFPYVDEGIDFMPSKPIGKISEEEHYFRNELNLQFAWDDFQKLQERLPDNLKWRELPWYQSIFHKFSFDTPWQGNNRKYVSACEHFEAVYTKEGYLVNETFNSTYMGTYNYYGPTQADKHKKYDVDPYFDYGNVR